MSLTLNRAAYERLLDEDVEWLLRQPESLEREHILAILLWVRKNKELLNGDRNDA